MVSAIDYSPGNIQKETKDNCSEMHSNSHFSRLRHSFEHWHANIRPTISADFGDQEPVAVAVEKERNDFFAAKETSACGECRRLCFRFTICRYRPSSTSSWFLAQSFLLSRNATPASSPVTIQSSGTNPAMPFSIAKWVLYAQERENSNASVSTFVIGHLIVKLKSWPKRASNQ